MTTDGRHFCLIYNDLGTGGIGTLILRAANWLASHGHGVDLVLLTRRGELVNSLDPRVGVNLAGRRRYLQGHRVANGHIARALKRADVLLCFDPGSFWYALQASAVCPLTTRFIVGSFHPRGFLPRNRNVVTTRLWTDAYRRQPAEARLFMSEEVRRAHASYHGFAAASGWVWPLPIDLGAVGTPVERHKRGTPLRVVSVGHLVDFKTYNLSFLDSLVRLTKNGHDVVWDVYGAGPLRTSMEAQIRRLNLEERVILRGTLPYGHLRRMLGEADLFLGMGTSLLEAAATGLPAIVAVASNPAASGYGFVHEMPYFACGEELPGRQLIAFEDLVSRVIHMSEDDYQGEVDRTRSYMAAYAADPLMELLLEIVNAAPTISRLEIPSSSRAILYSLFLAAYDAYARAKSSSSRWHSKVSGRSR